jgi:prophage regulatory protein
MGTKTQPSALPNTAFKVATPGNRPDNAPPHGVPRLLPMREVLARVGLSRGQVYFLIGEQRFPAPAKIGRRSLWPAQEIDAWIAAAIKQRDTLAAAA